MDVLARKRGAGGMERAEPKRAGATLKNFFAQKFSICAKLKIYIFLTFMHHNAAD